MNWVGRDAPICDATIRETLRYSHDDMSFLKMTRSNIAPLPLREGQELAKVVEIVNTRSTECYYDEVIAFVSTGRIQLVLCVRPHATLVLRKWMVSARLTMKRIVPRDGHNHC